MSEQPYRQWRVRVEASGYAIVVGRTKREAVENARQGHLVREPRPVWSARISDIKEIAADGPPVA